MTTRNYIPNQAIDSNLQIDLQAIILKKYDEQNHKIVLFNREIGKFQAYVKIKKNSLTHKTIPAGTLINYRQYSYIKNHYTIEILSIFDMPFDIAKEHILFLHHILEICYYFLPHESYDNHAIFDLLLFLYYRFGLKTKKYTQKIFLFRLLAHLGMYPESANYHTESFYSWMSCSLQELHEQKITQEIEHLLDIWLINCINDHPMATSFKTIHFLNEAKKHENYKL